MQRPSLSFLAALAGLMGALGLYPSDAAADAFNSSPEAAGYVLVYQLALPDAAAFHGKPVPYTVDNSKTVGLFDRVAYYLELQKPGGQPEWVWISVAAFSHSAGRLGVPNDVSGAHHQQFLADMNVFTNVPEKVTPVQGSAWGSIEFWPNNYGTANASGVPGASASLHDWGDAPVTPLAGYGSMQIHNYNAGQVVFAYNRWGSGGNSDLGIGNSPTGGPDWTFAQNAGGYSVKNLQVLVRPVARLAQQVPEAAGFALLYLLDVPGHASFNFNAGAVPYAVDQAAQVGPFNRVAYYMELETPGTGRRWLWASMSAFTDNPRLLGVPTLGSTASFQQDVSDLALLSNDPAIISGSFPDGGNLEFWPNSYGKTNAVSVPGASNDAYDTGDQPVTPVAGYGSMQVHNHATDQVLLAFNSWGSSGHLADLGIGNAPTGEPDWTFHENVAAHSVKLLAVFVEQGPGPVLTVTSPVAATLLQRDGKNHASITVSGTLNGAADFVAARVVPRKGFGGKATDWKDLPIIEAGARFSGTLSVSGGWYDLEVHASAGGKVTVTRTVSKIGVGEIFVTAGQSNSANHGLPTQTPKDERVLAHDLKTQWKPAADPQPIATGTGGTPWPDLGDILATKYDLPIGLVSVGWGGTSVTQWLPSAGDKYPRLRDAVKFLGPGGFRAVLWHQGETDNNNGMALDTYAANLQTVIDQSRLDAGFAVPWGVALVSYTPTKGVNASIIGGQLKVIDQDPLTFEGASTDDLVGAQWRHDGIHFNDAGLYEHARRWAEHLELNKCGDGACMEDETCSSCPQDCGSCCGDGICQADQSCETCPADCCCPACLNRQCGPDGCGGTCGACPAGWSCSDLGRCLEPQSEPGPEPVETDVSADLPRAEAGAEADDPGTDLSPADKLAPQELIGQEETSSHPDSPSDWGQWNTPVDEARREAHAGSGGCGMGAGDCGAPATLLLLWLLISFRSRPCRSRRG